MRISRTSFLSEYITTDRDILGGEPVFKGTRVPVRSLLDYLTAGDSLQLFFDDFPGVTPEHVRAVLIHLSEHLREPPSAA
jgi:uncharacterized protein (DUF433 family)